eukprot:6118473-Prymnesium_polylepis.1
MPSASSIVAIARPMAVDMLCIWAQAGRARVRGRGRIVPFALEASPATRHSAGQSTTRAAFLD